MPNEIYEVQVLPQFRDSDEDGLVGLRGYMNMFQDWATYHWHYLGFGNDTLLEEYGMAWVFTKYRMRVAGKAGFEAPLSVRTWNRLRKSPMRLHQDLEIAGPDGLLACGRLEMCLLDLQTGRLRRIDDLPIPADAYHDEAVDCGDFTRFRKAQEDAIEWQAGHQHVVRYSDLDKTRHMNNLRYIPMLLDQFGSEFYETHRIAGLELHYQHQCYEGDVIQMLHREREGAVDLAGRNAAGEVVARGILELG